MLRLPNSINLIFFSFYFCFDRKSGDLTLLTPTSDQDRISPYNINTILTR